jgi:uncharacterized protein
MYTLALENSQNMDISSILLLIGLGFCVGFIGTLIGAGGGFILVPVLLLLYPDLKPEAITSISLGVVFLNAGSGSFAYARMKRIDYKSALLFAMATLPGTISGAFLTYYLPKKIFNLILGIVLLVISIYLFIRPKGAISENKKKETGHTHRLITDRNGTQYSYSFNQWVGIGISFFVGFISGLLGIGGGIIHVPALTGLLNFPIHIATATSHLILAIMALAGTFVHIYQGTLNHSWSTMLLIGAGVMAGAQPAAYLSHHVKPNLIVRVLAIALLLVGVRILFS